MPSLREQLAQARDHVLVVQKRIEQQTILIDRLRSDGHDVDAAEGLLAILIDLMATVTMHRDQLEREAEEQARISN